jgi:hypothetical protein
MSSDELTIKRKNHEPPAAIAERGWRYHHLGVPTKIAMPGERYFDKFKLYLSGFDTSPYGIEWMRYEPDSPVDELIKTVPHIAFEVDDLEAALEGKKILTPPNSPSDGVRVAMIIHDGAPIELIQFPKLREV